MWRFKSLTIILSLGLFIYAVLFSKDELIAIALSSIALREKTQRKLNNATKESSERAEG